MQNALHHLIKTKCFLILKETSSMKKSVVHVSQKNNWKRPVFCLGPWIKLIRRPGNRNRESKIEFAKFGIGDRESSA